MSLWGKCVAGSCIPEHINWLMTKLKLSDLLPRIDSATIDEIRLIASDDHNLKLIFDAMEKPNKDQEDATRALSILCENVPMVGNSKTLKALSRAASNGNATTVQVFPPFCLPPPPSLML